MAGEIEIVKSSHGRVFVILHLACTIDKARILNLLSESGVDPSRVVFVLPEDVEVISDLDGLPVVIPLDEATCASPELEIAARKCNQSGGGIVVVFGENFPYSGLHPIAEKYGTQCNWSANSVRITITGNDTDIPFDAFGAPVERPRAGQVKC